ncbi:MAG TPA: hypothetical protein VF148_17670 [Acidimicrobiia bacterium]
MHLEQMSPPRAWEGFWQVLYHSADEEVVSFRDTTTAVRPALGFSILTTGAYMELRPTGRGRPPRGWPPTESEMVAMLRRLTAIAGAGEMGASRWSLAWRAHHHNGERPPPRVRDTGRFGRV